MKEYRKKLIEVALPLDAINAESAREKSIRHGHPSTLHMWWARRPLAAARAVLFAQLVDDPSAWPDRFPSQEAQERERERLFQIIRELVQWDNSANLDVLHRARTEIARSHAYGREEGDTSRPEAILSGSPSREDVDRYLAGMLPPLHDPFAGGGSIPLEAQRLGLRTIATDLNPVAVLLNKALIELPSGFESLPPANPLSRGLATWSRVTGLAEDVRHYGRRLRDVAFARIGVLYPDEQVGSSAGPGSATVLAWIWTRTAACPNPACGGSHVPLVNTFWLCKKKGREAWLVPKLDPDSRTWSFEVQTGKPQDRKAIGRGTKAGRGDYACVYCQGVLPASWIREQGQAGDLGARLLASVAKVGRDRVYLPATARAEKAGTLPYPEDDYETDLPERALGFRVQKYGLTAHRDLYTPRQFTALKTFSEAISEVRTEIEADLLAHPTWRSLGEDVRARYARAVCTYLAFGVSKAASRNCVLALWEVGMGRLAGALGRQALSMRMTFAETNPFAGAGGDIEGTVSSVAEVLDGLIAGQQGTAQQASATDARLGESASRIICTDPPYYDNVAYADLSDFFYVWLRRSLRSFYPQLLSTLLVPKNGELIAEPARHSGPREAEQYFQKAMQAALDNMRWAQMPDAPLTLFYAYKQAETNADGVSSTGWEMFLESVVRAGFCITGTWPMRTEQSSGLRDIGRNALASSIVLVCRPRDADARIATRAEFLRALKTELPKALRLLQSGSIAPVDLAQASIGPGMEVFSRHSKIMEADGTAMSVRSALQLVNQVLDSFLSEQEGELDADSRFAVTWFEGHQYGAGDYGKAETLAKARNVSVRGVVESGILNSAGGQVRLLRRDELPSDWDPKDDSRLTVWESTQHLIKRLDAEGEAGAAQLLAAMGRLAESARALAYRLYSVCERNKWAEEARAYNGLVVAWPELERLAASQAGDAGQSQQEMFE